MRDRIVIADLELSTCLGVPDEERLHPQRITATLILEPLTDFRALDDRIDRTINYAEVAQAAQTIARAHPRCLLETLAEEIANTVLATFPLYAIELELRKRILPDTAYVAVQIRRERA